MTVADTTKTAEEKSAEKPMNQKQADVIQKAAGPKSIIFDTGPIISLTTNNLLWVLEPMKKKFGGKFYITQSVKSELVEKSMSIKRFEFEGLQVMQLVNSGVLEIIGNDTLKARAETLLNLANSIFQAKGHCITMVHLGEMEALAACRYYNSELFVVDERTTRLLVEDPVRLQRIMEFRLKTKISVNKINLQAFQEKVKDIRIARSCEIATVAFRMGLLDKYLTSEKSMSKAREQLLESVLWGIKLRGCSVSEKEIEEMVRLES